MTQPAPDQDTRLPSTECPSWCTTDHGNQAGEEDRIHVGAPLVIADGVAARLCMSFDPATGEQDGPLVLIGDRECTADEAHALGVSLAQLAEQGRLTRSGAAG